MMLLFALILRSFFIYISTNRIPSLSGPLSFHRIRPDYLYTKGWAISILFPPLTILLPFSSPYFHFIHYCTLVHTFVLRHYQFSNTHSHLHLIKSYLWIYILLIPYKSFLPTSYILSTTHRGSLLTQTLKTYTHLLFLLPCSLAYLPQNKYLTYTPSLSSETPLLIINQTFTPSTNILAYIFPTTITKLIRF